MSSTRPDPLEDPMNQTTTVYGMPVELPEPPPGVIVTDVVILARAVPVEVGVIDVEGAVAIGVPFGVRNPGRHSGQELLLAPSVRRR